MATTLLDLLKPIDKIPDSVEVDKKKERRKILDKWRRRHPYVDKAARGDFSFSGAVNKLSEIYQGVRLFLPVFKSKEYQKRVKELNLNPLFYARNFEANWEYDVFMSPIVIGPLAEICVMALGMITGTGYESEIANFFALCGIGVVFGGGLGLLSAWIRHNDVKRATNNARYLDTVIQEAYLT